MKKLSLLALVLVVITLLIIPAVVSSRRIGKSRIRHGQLQPRFEPRTRGVQPRTRGIPMAAKPRRKGADTVEIAGSSLPDCSHACGSCSPCRLVMVSFVCSSLEEAETCPIAYKCMCNNKSYPVP